MSKEIKYNGVTYKLSDKEAEILASADNNPELFRMWETRKRPGYDSLAPGGGWNREFDRWLIGEVINKAATYDEKQATISIISFIGRDKGGRRGAGLWDENKAGLIKVISEKAVEFLARISLFALWRDEGKDPGISVPKSET